MSLQEVNENENRSANITVFNVTSMYDLLIRILRKIDKWPHWIRKAEELVFGFVIYGCVWSAGVGLWTHFTAIGNEVQKDFAIIKDKNTGLVESIDRYIQATARLAQAQKDLTTPAATVLRLQKEQAKSIAAITDANLRNSMALAATSEGLYCPKTCLP